MTSKLWASAAAGAIVAILTGAAARADAPVKAAEPLLLEDQRVVTDENGVRASPSGHVVIEVITAVRSPARTIKPAPAPKAAKASSKTMRTAAAAVAAKPRVVRLVSPKRLTVSLPDVAGPQYEEEAPVAVLAEAPKLDPRPVAISREAPATVQVAKAETVEVALLEPEPGVDEAPAEEASEEAAVYRRAPARAEPEAELLLARNVRARPAAPPPQDDGIRQHVAFPRRSAEAAAAFDGYMHAAAGIDAGFKSGAGVAAALHIGAAYDPRQLEEGMVAYGAMAALQSPRFVYGVMDAAADPQSRRALIDALLAEPWAATRLPGAEDAAGMASAAILDEASPVLSAGKALKQASYDVQHQSWSIAKASDQSGRLAHAKAVSARPATAGDQDMARLMTRISSVSSLGPQGGGGVSSAGARSVALAALSILDGASGEDERLDKLFHDRTSADCLRLAKLNLFQCLSVAGPEYENVYCLGQHAVLDTGQCVAGAAGGGSSALALNEPGPRMSRVPGLK